MARQRGATTDALLALTWLDFLPAAAAAGGWLIWGAGVTPTAEGSRVELYVAASTLAALALAAVTFVCAMVYQSASTPVEAVRVKFGPTLRRNWTAIITSALVAAVLPLVAIVVDGVSIGWAMALTVFSVALVVARFGRTIYFLRLTLFLQHAEAHAPKPYVVPGPAAKAS